MAILIPAMKRVLAQQRLGYVATVSPDGTPNLSPKGTVAVWDDDHLIFADLRSPRTIANLQHNPSVAINVVDPFLRKGYRFQGTATIVTAGPLFQAALAFYAQQGLSDTPRRIRAIVLVKVEQARPLISPAYEGNVTEDEVHRQWVAYYGALWAERSGDEKE